MAVNYNRERKDRAKSSNLRPLARLLPFLMPYRGKFVIAIIALLVASAVTLFVPIAVRRLIDNGFSAESAPIINQYFGLMLAVVCLLAASSATRFYYVMWLGDRIVADVRDVLFHHVTTLTPSFFEVQKTGEVVSRLTADTTLIKSAFSSTASVALRNMVMFIGALVMMIYTSPKLSSVAALGIPVIVIPLVVYGQKVRKLSRIAQDALAASAAFAQERLTAIAAVQANTQEPATVHEFNAATKTAFAAAVKRTFARACLTFAIILITLGANVGILWFGAREVIQGSLSVGTLSQFLLYAIFAASSLGQLSEVWGEIQSAAGAAERISELLDEKPTLSSPPNPLAMATPIKGEITMSNVDFRYPSRPELAVLSNINFTARAGKVLAIVGPSGAGKSTLFQLLQRFYDPPAGDIAIDGLPIRDLDLFELRNAMALVPQETMIFSGSILENIRFGKPNATLAEIHAAAKSARVDIFTEVLPQRFDTQVGERGMTLSGGQRQRIAIARAILRNAPILLLDEATSALDAESEALIQEALEHLTTNRTTLVIAHRLATVRNADSILVMDHGTIVAQGTHAQLIKKSPLYARLAKLQFSVPLA